MSALLSLQNTPVFSHTETALELLARAKMSGSVRSRSKVGLVLLDSSYRPIFYNAEARRILGYPHTASRKADAAFSQSIRSLARQTTGAEIAVTTHVVSGRRRYMCRAFGLEPVSSDGSAPVIAVMLERDTAFRDQVARFHLTAREIEVVQHLASGLTSKEIADRMNISLNTVKTFFRLLMIKMGVTTRAGVIGKLVPGASTHTGQP